MDLDLKTLHRFVGPVLLKADVVRPPFMRHPLAETAQEEEHDAEHLCDELQEEAQKGEDEAQLHDVSGKRLGADSQRSAVSTSPPDWRWVKALPVAMRPAVERAI